ncbi:MAG: type 4a pilus biogenesis protein PilO [Pseudomonadota bacterium]
MTLDDLNNLNLKDLANAQMGVKVVILAVLFVVIVFAGYWFGWSSQLDALNAAKQEEMSLRDTFMNKKRQAINLDAYKQQLKDIEHSFGALLKQLPNKSEMDALLTDINQAGLGRGLQFELFKPGTEKIGDFYAELPINVRLTGTYHDLGAFASDIAQLPRIVTLHDIEISPDKNGVLTMNAVVKTYRYLDADEIAAQKKNAKGAAKK